MPFYRAFLVIVLRVSVLCVDGPTERPVIEIEAKDMKGSEIYDAILGANVPM